MEKPEMITFKVPAALKRAMAGIPNRSEFIRAAVLAALDGVCPLCRGTGILTSDQKQHWELFAENHTVEVCGTCKATHLVCNSVTEEDSGSRKCS